VHVPSDEQQVRDLIATWISATELGDSERVLALIADDAVFLTPGAPPMGKAEFASAQAGLKQIRLSISSELQEIRIMGQWAYCWNHLKIVVTPPGGATVTRAGNSLSILQKRTGSWLLVRDANLVTVVPGKA
jgi:uncharacterized protein (TIGR02246 family)